MEVVQYGHMWVTPQCAPGTSIAAKLCFAIPKHNHVQAVPKSDCKFLHFNWVIQRRDLFFKKNFNTDFPGGKKKSACISL